MVFSCGPSPAVPRAARPVSGGYLVKLDISKKYALSFGLLSLVVVTVLVLSFALIVDRQGHAFRARLEDEEQRVYEENQSRAFLKAASALSRHLFVPVQQRDTGEINRMLGPVQAVLPVRSFVVMDTSGTVLSRWPRTDRAGGPQSADLARLGTETVLSERTREAHRILFSIREGAAVAGYGEIVLSDDHLTSSREQHDELLSGSWAEFTGAVGRVGIVGVLVVLAIAGLLSLRFSRTLSRPLETLREAANCIARGDLSCTVNVDSRDEIGDLTAAFNRMVLDLRQSTESLQEANRKLMALGLLKSEVIAVVSHELRSPLTSIKAFAELLMMKPRMVEPRRMRLLGIINSESERLTRLINDLLDLAKLEEGNLSWRVDPLSIDEVIDQSLAAIQPLAEGNGLFLEREIGPGLPAVHGDRDRLVQVVTNLLSNAIKFTSTGGSIRVRARHEGYPQQQIVVSVTDTGAGIPAESLALIFEKFHRAGGALNGGREGTGLGLSIARQIVEHHGGTMWAESSVGAGSTFFFTLPLNGTATTAQSLQTMTA